jgi:glucosamine--fructose-6-phosphate aminotransferase (isomerizing)
MHTDLAPGRIFLAQRGSGQAIFVGLAEDHYMPASEVYGFTEETDRYLKLDGESVIDGRAGQTQGQIFILDQSSAGSLEGISATYYDGSPLRLSEDDVKTTALTSRDIDRQGFSHYFLKEISESPASVESTLQNRWKIKGRGEDQRLAVELDDTVIPLRLRQALSEGAIRRVFFIGQGTAGVAALACANILSFYLNSPSISVSALKASEFSGFSLDEGDRPDTLSDALIVAISQSGTTTDTNRTVEMVKERGAYTLAIVNRRDSDITFKVDGVMYTSSGRDIEMSVASTKAFYSQIIAGALLGLFLARLQNRRDDEFVSNEIQQLRAIPDRMRQVLAGRRQIETSAARLAVSKTFWAAVGSGPNKASADEIRIKLSELCYKTISSDYVEDKKHIDLSSEPLIIVCAAGTRPAVVGDIIKDTAIFKAHKATPVVIANEGEKRFDPYAADVIHVPPVAEHLAPILNTLVGHIWGYYAALAINDGSRFLYRMQDDVQQTLNDQSEEGLDIYEIILEQSFREKIARYYFEFRQKVSEKRFPTTVGFDGATDIMLLLKYLSGRLPVSDFELDFGHKGTPANMLNTLFGCLTGAISYLARPVDAIKHQAKTVTVGTSRVSERLEGVLFDILAEENFQPAQLTNQNIIVLKRLQPIVSSLEGSILYRIDGLNLLGEPGDETTIQVKNKKGSAAKLSSRVEKDAQLKGSKRTIVREGNVYIGKGRKDDRSILVIPILSGSSAKPGIIEYLLLLHINFMDRVPLATRIKALGGKYEKIKNIVQENSVAWSEDLLETVAIDELFGRSAEKVAEYIVTKVG